MKYKIYQENDLYTIYDVYGRLIAKCRDINQVKLTLKYLTNPQPANSSSILNEPIAKMTRILIEMDK